MERGGDATYHGPGQVVLYPVMRLEGARRDLHKLLRDLEDTVIRAVAALGVQALREPGLTGVWAADRKIASIGIAVRNWVSFHGVALNLTPDAGFSAIRACGLDSGRMASLEELAGRSFTRHEVVDALLAAFGQVFDREGPRAAASLPRPPGVHSR